MRLSGTYSEKIAGLSVLHSIPAVRRFILPLVFIHGAWCTGVMFKWFMTMLAHLGFESYSITLRGHGDSKEVEDIGKVMLKEYVDDVCDVIEAIGEPVILIGHSMGALVTFKAARRKASHVLGAIFLASAPPTGIIMGWRMLLRLYKYIARVGKRQSTFLKTEDAKILLFNRCEEKDIPEHMSHMCPESGTVAIEQILWMHNYKPLHCPTLVIGGEFDNICPYQGSIRRRLKATFVEVPCGHMMMIDPQGSLVVVAITEWLEEKLGRYLISPVPLRKTA